MRFVREADDDIAEKLKSHGVLVRGRKHIDHAAATITIAAGQLVNNRIASVSAG